MSGQNLRGVFFAVAAPGPPSNHGKGGSAQGINNGHAVHRFTHILKDGVPEVLGLAFAVFVNAAIRLLCPEIVVTVPEIVDQPGNVKQSNGDSSVMPLS